MKWKWEGMEWNNVASMGRSRTEWEGMKKCGNEGERVDAIDIYTHEKNRARRVTDQLTLAGKSCLYM